MKLRRSRRLDDVEACPELDGIGEELDAIDRDADGFRNGSRGDPASTDEIFAMDLEDAERSAAWRPLGDCVYDGVHILPARPDQEVDRG